MIDPFERDPYGPSCLVSKALNSYKNSNRQKTAARARVRSIICSLDVDQLKISGAEYQSYQDPVMDKDMEG